MKEAQKHTWAARCETPEEKKFRIEYLIDIERNQLKEFCTVGDFENVNKCAARIKQLENNNTTTV